MSRAGGRHDVAAQARDVAAQIEAIRRRRGGATTGGGTTGGGTTGGTTGRASSMPPPPAAIAHGGPETAHERSRCALERLRAARGRAERDLAIAPLVKDLRKQSARLERRLAGLAEAWEVEVPAEVAACTRLGSFRGGTLHVIADSSAVSFELDRLLREGLLARLRARHAAPLTRVRVSIGG